MTTTETAATGVGQARKTASDGFISADSDNITIFPDQVTDNLMHVVIALGAELWTVRRRTMILERVLEKVGVSSQDIELFAPTIEDLDQWQEERDLFIKRTFGALTRKGGANEKQMDFSRMK